MPETRGSNVIPSLRYRDAHKAIDWLVAAFGFTAQAVYDGPDNTVAHAQLVLENSSGKGMIMLGSFSNGGEMADLTVHPADTGNRTTHTLYLVVPDATAAYEKAKAVGAQIAGELRTMDYGGKAFSCIDLEGYHWSLGEYDPWA